MRVRGAGMCKAKVTKRHKVDYGRGMVYQVGLMKPDHYHEWVHNEPLKGNPAQHNGLRAMRMFDSDFMELFSKTPWWVVIAVWWPVLYLWMSAYSTQVSMYSQWFLYGFLLWFPCEYAMHRFVFHFKPSSAFGVRMHFMFHGVHHKAPCDEMRLVMPPVVTFLILGSHYAVFRMLLPGDGQANILMCGFTFAYTVYDNTHYALHHMRASAMKRIPVIGSRLDHLKKHHEKHHYHDWDKRFGVSSVLFDVLMGS